LTGKKPKHYVNNKDFHKALQEYHKICSDLRKKNKALPQIPEYIGVCINMICEKLGMKYNFIRYTFLEEMKGDARENCCAAVDNYNPDRSNNPFSYFTTIAWNAFVRRIEREGAQNYTKHKNLENMMVLSDEFYSELGASEYSMSGGKAEGPAAGSDNEGLQRHYDVIRNFEAKQARKKEKNRQTTLKKSKPIISKKHTRRKP
jgi:hypothetical protein